MQNHTHYFSRYFILEWKAASERSARLLIESVSVQSDQCVGNMMTEEN